MHAAFAVVSDGSCDLPAAEAKKNNIDVVHFLVSFDGQDYRREGLEIPLEAFYQKMVDEPGHYPKTAAPSPEDFCEVFRARAAEGLDILCICISTKLSSSMQSAQIAAKMLADDYPDTRVIVQDSLCATLMQSAYVLEACRLRDAGCTLQAAADALAGLQRTARILFTVGSLDYIQHGGRIGRMTGLAGYGYDRAEGVRFRDMTVSRLSEEFGGTADLPLFQIGATIGVHAGPTSIGFGVIQKADLP